MLSLIPGQEKVIGVIFDFNYCMIRAFDFLKMKLHYIVSNKQFCLNAVRMTKKPTDGDGFLYYAMVCTHYRNRDGEPFFFIVPVLVPVPFPVPVPCNVCKLLVHD